MIAELILPATAKDKDLGFTPWIGTQTRYHQGCGDCKHFEACKETKAVKADTDYCQWPPRIRKFELRRD